MYQDRNDSNISDIKKHMIIVCKALDGTVRRVKQAAFSAFQSTAPEIMTIEKFLVQKKKKRESFYESVGKKKPWE